MTAVVEVRLIGADLGTTMSQMRIWLDHGKIRPDAFRESRCPDGLALYLDFASPSDAEAFAATFGGRVLDARPAP